MIHVIPANDAKPHDATPECPCNPVVEMDAGCWEPVCIHNAWDEREAYERKMGDGIPGKGWRNVRSGHTEGM
jgi:hypothetical protein